jgi:hypothetical protein
MLRKKQALPSAPHHEDTLGDWTQLHVLLTSALDQVVRLVLGRVSVLIIWEAGWVLELFQTVAKRKWEDNKKKEG